MEIHNYYKKPPAHAIEYGSDGSTSFDNGKTYDAEGREVLTADSGRLYVVEQYSNGTQLMSDGKIIPIEEVSHV